MTMELGDDIILEMFKGIELKLENIRIQNGNIHEQTIKTNGRVTSLEGGQKSLEVWRGVMAGGLAVLAAVVVPLLLFILSRIVT